MSAGSKKVSKKIKRTTEKDKRMAQLEKEISRLENENSKLKRDSIGYESRLAAFDGTSRFVNRELQPVANKRASLKSKNDFGSATQAKSSKEDDASCKKKFRAKLMNISKKTDGKK
ncbi:hypothetical protein WH47_06061 [Habropoda laboriosa]|uniref:Uncharacterized protein n=1 Tax=Habropoda laboriosa TaxID=597456 RepID=A0A0L7QTQ7_9HYME|nr:hypothetical protein WH47_06061 [Habropoda laboriosa]